ncbi:MAG: efflux RND transporter periplasmic adaptor subunit [Adhaeribacter sp.]
MKRYFNLLLLLLTLAAAACSGAGDKPQQQAPDHAHTGTTYTCPMHPQIVRQEPGTCPVCHMDLVPLTPAGTGQQELMLSESQITLGNIQVRPVNQGALGRHTLLSGRLVLDETQSEVISSRAAGRIEKLYIKETGQPVRKGQPLYQLYSEQLLTLEQEYLLALRQFQELGKENPRLGTFLEGARQKLLLYGLSAGQVASLGRQGKADARITFLAPASGVVTEVAASEGQYLAEGGLLYRLGVLGRIWVEAELYPQEASRLQPGTRVQVKVPGAGPQPLAAQVSFLSPELRAGSQVVLLRAELPNPDGALLPGMPAEVSLPGKAQQQITLPVDAVIRDGKGSHVWVQTGKGTFQARMVTLGEESADQVAVLSGLQESDQVVTSGAYLLYSEFVLKKGSDPMAGHQH